MNKKSRLHYEAFVAVILSFIGGILDVYCLFNFKDKKHDFSITVYLLIFTFFILGAAAGYAYLRLLPEFQTAFMSRYAYNLLLIVQLICMMILYILSAPKYKE